MAAQIDEAMGEDKFRLYRRDYYEGKYMVRYWRLWTPELEAVIPQLSAHARKEIAGLREE